MDRKHRSFWAGPAAFLLPVALLAGACTPLFEESTEYAVGESPYSVAVGDFNGDGHPDLVAANTFGNTVSVLLGNGDGTFQAAVDYPVGGFPFSVAVGDFNGNSLLDLVTANALWPHAGNVSVLLGNGDGTFQAAVDYPVSGKDYVFSVAVADLDGDGHPDLVTANSMEPGFWMFSSVSILLGNGDGSFEYAAGYDCGGVEYETPMVSVVAGDFSGDGHPDVAILGCNPGNPGVQLLLGNGDGTFEAGTEIALGHAPLSGAAWDFNGNGHLDLAVGRAGADTVTILLGNGDGTFQNPVDYGAGDRPYGVAVADFDGDGHPDLAVGNPVGNSVSVLLGLGDGTFKDPVGYEVGGSPLSVAVGDFNGNGRPDIVTANRDDNTVSVLLNTLSDVSCFIATAAFGSVQEGKLHVLRSFRDSHLNTHPAGRAFLEAYSTWSPPVADAIARRPWLRSVVRVLLAPAIGLASLLM